MQEQLVRIIAALNLIMVFGPIIIAAIYLVLKTIIDWFIDKAIEKENRGTQ